MTGERVLSGLQQSSRHGRRRDTPSGGGEGERQRALLPIPMLDTRIRFTVTVYDFCRRASSGWTFNHAVILFYIHDELRGNFVARQ